MAAIAQTVSPMIADDIAAATVAGAPAPPAPVGNPLKLKKAAAELFASEGHETLTDISFLQVSVAKLLSMAVKTRKMPTEETETYTGKDGTEKTRKVKTETKVIQLTLDYDTFFGSICDAPSDYRVTNAEIPTGAIASRVVTGKAKKVATPKKAKAAADPAAPKKAKAAASPKAAAAASPKVLAMPVLTEEQLKTLLLARPPIAPKAQVRTLKVHLTKMGVEEKDFKQARADWVAYRADHAPPAMAALLDDAKMEHLRALEIGPRPQVRNPKMVAAFEEWGISTEEDRKRATVEYRTWAKENGVESTKGSKTSSPKASAPLAIKAPATATSDDDEEEEEDGTPMSDAGELHDTALEAIGDAEDIGAFE